MKTKQQLVEDYVPLADKLAYKKKKSLPNFIDVEDLRSAAYLGLVEAASRFDKTRGVLFSTYAYPRIWGSIQDYLRDQGWGKRGEFIRVCSLDATIADSDDCSLKDTIEGKEEFNDDEFLEVITSNLNEQAEEVIKLYFIDEYSMKEVGQKFGVSESRISQLIKEYKDCIRKDWSEEDLRMMLAA